MASATQENDEILYQDDDQKHLLRDGIILSYRRYRDNGHYLEDTYVSSVARYALGRMFTRLRGSLAHHVADTEADTANLLSMIGSTPKHGDDLGDAVTKVEAELSRLRHENGQLKEQAIEWQKRVTDSFTTAEACRSVIRRAMLNLGCQAAKISNSTPEQQLLTVVTEHEAVIGEAFAKLKSQASSYGHQTETMRTSLNSERNTLKECRAIIREALEKLWSRIPQTQTPETCLLDVVDATTTSLKGLQSSIEANREARARTIGNGEDEDALRCTVDAMQPGRSEPIMVAANTTIVRLRDDLARAKSTAAVSIDLGMTPENVTTLRELLKSRALDSKGHSLFECAISALSHAIKRLDTHSYYGDGREDQALRTAIRDAGQSSDMPLLQAARLTIGILRSKNNEQTWSQRHADLATECGITEESVSDLRAALTKSGIPSDGCSLIPHARAAIDLLHAQLLLKGAKPVALPTKPLPPGTYDVGNGCTWTIGAAFAPVELNSHKLD